MRLRDHRNRLRRGNILKNIKRIDADVGVITTLTATTATLTTGDITTGNITTGVFTTVSGTTGKFRTAKIADEMQIPCLTSGASNDLGTMYYNSGTTYLYIWNGSAWKSGLIH